jgi:hypothetical protein
MPAFTAVNLNDDTAGNRSVLEITPKQPSDVFQPLGVLL